MLFPQKEVHQMLFPDVTCTVSESLKKNREYGLYDVLELDGMIVITLFRQNHKIQVNGIIENRKIDQNKIFRFIECCWDRIFAGEKFSNFFWEGCYYHMTSKKQAKPFLAFTLVIREGSPFPEKDLLWLDVYEKLNYQRTLIENEAFQNKNLYDNLFEGVPFAIAALNLSGKVLRMNPSASRLFGVCQDHAFVLARPEQNKILQAMIHQAILTNDRQTNQEFVFGQDDDIRVLSLSVSPLQNSKNQTAGVIVLASDKTEKRLLTAEVEQLKQYGFLGEFSMGLAHDIKNPLMIINGCAKKIPQNNQQGEHLRNIISFQVERINEVISELMTLGSSMRDPAEAMVDLNVVLQNCHTMATRQRTGPQAAIRMDLAPDLPQFYAKEVHLRQIFSNLLVNAMDAVGDDGNILMKSRSDENQIQVVISDDGCGIPRELQKKIFIPYFTTKRNGTGMGLFIVKRILEQYGGSISIESEPGKGTACRVSLPITHKGPECAKSQE